MCQCLNHYIHETGVSLVDKAPESNARLVRYKQSFFKLLQVWNFGIFRSKVEQISVTQTKVRFLFLLVDIANQLKLIIVNIIPTVDTINVTMG